MRKDHLRLVTDAGAALDLGWDYGIPYQIDNLSGVDVTLKTAQGVNQQGVTVEGQSVEGVPHEVIADFWGPDGEAQADRFLQLLPFFTSGTMYFGDAYFSRFVLQKTPYTVQLHPYPRLDFMLYRPKPYWYSLESQNAVMGGFVPQFRFPLCYDSHQYNRTSETGTRTTSTASGGRATSSMSETPVRCRCLSPRSSSPRVSWSTQPSATAPLGSTSALTPP